MNHARLTSVLLGLACVLPSTLAAQNACGVERWPVKIWADDDSARVDTVPIPITIAELVQIPAPLESRPQRNRVGDAEFRTFLVRGRLMAVLPQDDDSDIHVVLRDLEQPNATVVAEIPHPGCTAVERHAKLFDEARRALRTVPRNGIVEVLGIGFFDRLHGQRGMFPNGLEIHPVLRLRVIEDLTRQTLFASPQDSAPIRPDSVNRRSVVYSDSVWVNTSSGVYHCPGTRWYGQTKRGLFTTERAALESGSRPAGGRSCRDQRATAKPPTRN